VHHTGAGAADIPRHPGSRRESGLAAQFTAVFTGHGIHCVATPRKRSQPAWTRRPAATATTITSGARIP